MTEYERGYQAGREAQKAHTIAAANAGGFPAASAEEVLQALREGGLRIAADRLAEQIQAEEAEIDRQFRAVGRE